MLILAKYLDMARSAMLSSALHFPRRIKLVLIDNFFIVVLDAKCFFLLMLQDPGRIHDWIQGGPYGDFVVVLGKETCVSRAFIVLARLVR